MFIFLVFPPTKKEEEREGSALALLASLPPSTFTSTPPSPITTTISINQVKITKERRAASKEGKRPSQLPTSQTLCALSGRTEEEITKNIEKFYYLLFFILHNKDSLFAMKSSVAFSPLCLAITDGHKKAISFKMQFWPAFTILTIFHMNICSSFVRQE